MHWKGAHDPNRLYRRGNEVMDGGVLYVCILDTSASFPASAPGDDSTHWTPQASGASVQPFVAPPPVSEWTWANQTTTTIEDTPGGILFTSGPDDTGAVNVLLKGEVPAAPYTITMGFDISVGKGADLTLFDSISGKIAQSYYYFDDFVTYAGQTPTYNNVVFPDAILVYWVRATDDGVNRILSYSGDGDIFSPYSIAPNDDFMVPTHFGVSVSGISPLEGYPQIIYSKLVSLVVSTS